MVNDGLLFVNTCLPLLPYMIGLATMTLTKRQETEAAILASARTQFSRYGFERVGVRDIADAAGVNAALVIRYFGSKEELFEQAVLQEVELVQLFELPREQLGEVLVRYILSKKDTDSLLALLRSAGHEQASVLLRQSLEAQFITPLTALLEGKDKTLRAGLIAAQLLGIALMRDVVASGSLAGVDETRIVTLYAPLIQKLIDGG